MGLEWIAFARTGMINISSAALKRGEQGVSLKTRKNQEMEKIRELNPWENITGREQRGRKQLVGAETVVDQYHRFGLSLSGFLVVKIAFDDVNGCWNGGGSISSLWTCVERILAGGNCVWRCQLTLKGQWKNFIGWNVCWEYFIGRLHGWNVVYFVSMLENLAPYPERWVKHDGLTIEDPQQQICNAAKTTTKSM